MLLRLYTYYADSDPNSKSIDPEYSQVNGSNRMNTHVHTPSQQIRDAEEFELDGLMTDDEDDVVASKQNGRAQGA